MTYGDVEGFPENSLVHLRRRKRQSQRLRLDSLEVRPEIEIQMPVIYWEQGRKVGEGREPSRDKPQPDPMGHGVQNCPHAEVGGDCPFVPLYLPVPKRQGVGISLVGCSCQPKANLRDGEQPGATSNQSPSRPTQRASGRYPMPPLRPWRQLMNSLPPQLHCLHRFSFRRLGWMPVFHKVMVCSVWESNLSLCTS